MADTAQMDTKARFSHIFVSQHSYDRFHCAQGVYRSPGRKSGRYLGTLLAVLVSIDGIDSYSYYSRSNPLCRQPKCWEEAASSGKCLSEYAQVAEALGLVCQKTWRTISMVQ